MSFLWIIHAYPFWPVNFRLRNQQMVLWEIPCRFKPVLFKGQLYIIEGRKWPKRVTVAQGWSGLSGCRLQMLLLGSLDHFPRAIVMAVVRWQSLGASCRDYFGRIPCLFSCAYLGIAVVKKIQSEWWTFSSQFHSATKLLALGNNTSPPPVLF